MGMGILLLPKILAPLGLFWGSVVLFIMAFFLAMTAIMLVEVAYLTVPRYTYFDLASHYLGRLGIVSVVATLLAGYGAVLTYVSGLGKLFAGYFGGESLIWSFLIWMPLSLILLFGTRISSSMRESLVVLIALLVITAFLWALPEFEVRTNPFDFSAFVSALGISVFAFPLHIIIPYVLHGVRNMNKTIITILISFAVAFALYVLFFSSVGADVWEGPVLRSMDGDLSSVLVTLPFLAVVVSSVCVGAVLPSIFRNWRIAGITILALPLLASFLGVDTVWPSVVGTTLVSGIIPPILFILARKERRRSLTPLPNWFAYLTIAFFSTLCMSPFI